MFAFDQVRLLEDEVKFVQKYPCACNVLCFETLMYCIAVSPGACHMSVNIFMGIATLPPLFVHRAPSQPPLPSPAMHGLCSYYRQFPFNPVSGGYFRSVSPLPALFRVGESCHSSLFGSRCFHGQNNYCCCCSLCFNTHEDVWRVLLVFIACYTPAPHTPD